MSDLINKKGRYLAIPSVCPSCGTSQEGFTIAIEATIFRSTNPKERNQVIECVHRGIDATFSEHDTNDDASVRVFCNDCGEYLPLSECLAQELQQSIETK